MFVLFVENTEVIAELVVALVVELVEVIAELVVALVFVGFVVAVFVLFEVFDLVFYLFPKIFVYISPASP